jgi:hypothetical protein
MGNLMVIARTLIWMAMGDARFSLAHLPKDSKATLILTPSAIALVSFSPPRGVEFPFD